MDFRKLRTTTTVAATINLHLYGNVWCGSGFGNVLGIFTSIVPRRAIVADCERKGLARFCISKVLANHGGTADGSGALPYDLREMTPAIEVAHIGIILAVVGLKVHHFIIVHHVGKQRTNVISRDAIANVLAISIDRTSGRLDRSIMLVDTAAGEDLRAVFEFAIPSKIACRVVGAVDIVMV